MLTRRGWAVAAVAAVAVAMAGWFGARSLNGVVAPAAVALAAGYVQLRRTPRPDLRVEAPEYGFAGDAAEVAVAFDTETPLAGAVELTARGPLALAGDSVETTVTDEPIAFGLELRERGVGAVGPVELRVEDVFGLWTATHRYSIRRDVTVFPRRRRLTDANELAALDRTLGIDGRDRFDQLREYERGDSLRDVHWKTSAKRTDDLVVMEYEADDRRGRIELLAEADPGRADETAEAAASVAGYLLDAGVAVGLTLPSDRIEPGTGPAHRIAVYAALARLSAGTVVDSRRGNPDVAVEGFEGEAVRVAAAGRSVEFARLAGPPAEPAVSPGSERSGRAAVTDGGEHR
ncbi:DUF58 domain-containing protein [Halorussus marinus]|uniref:DUF58 domain-containing protein n=1 Tax=Halorussus marinus TaxID=2505976 RepID=UPI00109290DF|nr:DUF58 domain-containing protein [Halorussus marinus]